MNSKITVCQKCRCLIQGNQSHDCIDEEYKQALRQLISDATNAEEQFQYEELEQWLENYAGGTQSNMEMSQDQQ